MSKFEAVEWAQIMDRLTQEELDRLARERSELQEKFMLSDDSLENRLIGERISQIRSILLANGYIKEEKPRQTRRPPVINFNKRK